MMFDFEKRDRPVLKWAGGKSKLLPQMLSHFPNQFDRYLEPFLGGGAVFFSLKSATRAIINDSNPELVNLYSVIRDNPDSLISSLNSLSAAYSEEFYYDLRSQRPESSVDRAARTLFLNKTGFNGLYRQNGKGEFNVPFGKRLRCPALCDPENILAISGRLQKASLVNLDFEALLNQAQGGDFVYCDPPYEPLSHTSSFNAYNGGGFSQSEQIRLRNSCVAAVTRGAVVAVSNSSALFIKEIYEGWNIHTIKARRAINSKGDGRGEIDEVLVLMEQKPNS